MTTTETKPTKHRISAALKFLIAEKKDDLTVRQIAVLVACAKKKQTVRGLAKAIGVTRPPITRAIDRLEEFGFATRTQDTKDRRSIFVTLTKDGAAFAANFS